jgi:hypothetical protein
MSSIVCRHSKGILTSWKTKLQNKEVNYARVAETRTNFLEMEKHEHIVSGVEKDDTLAKHAQA